MPLKKLALIPGVNKENTRYTNENGWYDCDKIRFRQGTPEKIGGWLRISANTFLGVCRSLWSWVTLGSLNLIGVGTNLKFYISNGGGYYDITPIITTNTLTNPFSMVANSSTVTVADPTLGYVSNQFVTFTGSTINGGITLLGEYQLTIGSVSATYTVPITSSTIITIANPAIFTTQFQLADTVQVTLSTTGALPYPFIAATIYYVVSTSGYTFSLSATSGGAAISTFGSTQSGTHTVTAKALTTAASGGGTVKASYQLIPGPDSAVSITGWGAGGWGGGTWGVGASNNLPMRLWSQSNFGQDLIFGAKGGAMYYWNANIGISPTTVTITYASPAVLTSSSLNFENGEALQLTTTNALPTGLSVGTIYYVINASTSTCNLSATYNGVAINTGSSGSGTHYVSSRAIPLTSLGGANDVPTIQNTLIISDTSRFVFAFGCNDYGSTIQDPMLIRWSDQESFTDWNITTTSQAGFIRLSHGSKIISVMQARQEILVWTDSSLYSLQYIGPPGVWSSQLVGDNISILSQNSVAYANGIAYWMGIDKFYKYDGRTQTLICDLWRYVFQNINKSQLDQVFASTNEGFNEIWWFYCSGTSSVIDSYVVYNYAESNGKNGTGIWYYGSMGRTAWLDSGLNNYPIAATYSNNLVNHEYGVDDATSGTNVAIESFITSAEFDLDDGDKFGFIWRVLPDVTFTGSSAVSPQLTMYLKPMQNSGSGYNNPESLGGSNNATVTRTAELPIEAFTGQIYTRVRGRQMAIEVRSTDLGVNWQLGSPRIDIRQDGKR